MKKQGTLLVLAIVSIGFLASCSARPELTREQRTEKLRNQARIANKERHEGQLNNLRQGQAEAAREQALEQSRQSSKPE